MKWVLQFGSADEIRKSGDDEMKSADGGDRMLRPLAKKGRDLRWSDEEMEVRVRGKQR